MIDVKRKIYIDLVALYDLAYQNDFPKHVLGALSRAEHLIWELRRREDKTAAEIMKEVAATNTGVLSDG